MEFLITKLFIVHDNIYFLFEYTNLFLLAGNAPMMYECEVEAGGKQS